MATLVIGIGPVVPFSPYALLSKLPVLDTLHIPSRWFGWTLFLGVLALGSVRRWPRWGNLLLAASVLELHAANLLAPTPFQTPAPPAVAAPFAPYEDYPRPPGARSAMYEAMRSGHGEIRAYEPMLGYDSHRPTRRCGINKSCGMVTGNGRLSRWSPNEIDVQRQGPGPIFVNINPGRYWLVDGQRYPGNPRVTEPTWSFVVDGAGPFQLRVRPARSWLLFVPLLSLAWLGLWRFTADRRRSRSRPLPR